MHDLLFHGQKALADEDLRRYACELELDVTRFENDRASAAVLDRIWRDVQSAVASGEVQATPTIFIDGELHMGPYDATRLLDALPQ
jgi:protein-disulfide isomerase